MNNIYFGAETHCETFNIGQMFYTGVWFLVSPERELSKGPCLNCTVCSCSGMNKHLKWVTRLSPTLSQLCSVPRAHGAKKRKREEKKRKDRKETERSRESFETLRDNWPRHRPRGHVCSHIEKWNLFWMLALLAFRVLDVSPKSRGHIVHHLVPI